MLTVAALAAACVAVFLWLAPRAREFTPRRTALRQALGALTGNLRSGVLWVLYLQGFLTMGGFVAMYNYVTFHLASEPFSLPLWLISFIFLAYLAGTISSPQAGRLASAWGRRPVLLGGNVIMMVGVGLTLVPALPAILLGMVLLTGGFFASHAVAAGWVGSAAVAGRSQSASLYNLGYYAGSSVLGFAAGASFRSRGGRALWAWCSPWCWQPRRWPSGCCRANDRRGMSRIV
ncbi:hypothetical protein [Nesterenkonia pannonica]|uniref:hypothetical protein n=1 Tax=Nesterenkonia pannonica TaxID=1548602 RepID=UPI0021649844|nr:hypothetical protein [Nesterenkonia pannonica]